MSSPRYATPLNLELRPSRRLATWLMLVHALALAALCLPMSVPIVLRLVLACVIGWHLWHTLPRHAWLSDPDAVVRLVWGEDGQWTLVTRGGRTQLGTVLGDSYVSVPLVVLRLACEEGRRRAVVLVGDMLDADTLRRLRVRLRLEGSSEREG